MIIKDKIELILEANNMSLLDYPIDSYGQLLHPKDMPKQWLKFPVVKVTLPVWYNCTK